MEKSGFKSGLSNVTRSVVGAVNGQITKCLMGKGVLGES